MTVDGDLVANFAGIFELIADAVPDRLFLVAGEVRLTYAEMDGRADRAARLLREAGVGPGDHVGIYAMNRAEWVEVMIACLKLRAVPININYRYVAAELSYLLDNADLVSIVVDERYLATLEAALPGIATVRSVIVLPDGASPSTAPARGRALGGCAVMDYESEPVDGAAVRVPRSGNDPFVTYTGGTTGMPKGVIWRSEDLFFASTRRPLPDGSIPRRVEDLLAHTSSPPVVTLTLAPLMHGTAQQGILTAFAAAGTAVLWTGREFDASQVLRLAATERAVSFAVVGDSMAAPILDALGADPDRYDLSALATLISAGAPLSEGVRERVRTQLPHVVIRNVYGGTEVGHTGTEVSSAGRPRRFRLSADACVLDDMLRPIQPGSPAVGRIARSGRIPVGYYKDPAKTAATFPTDPDGTRWAIPGDLARVEEDGTVLLLGRENTVVNTGGEKVFPDEVEEALKGHDGVADAVVIGAPDARFGERVVALVVARGGRALDVSAVKAHCRSLIAGYKVPKEILVVDALIRSPSGKIDIRWARRTAAQLSAAGS
ncbi:AMP-binding protein [Frankia sp. AgB1.9]|uniref:AMP-binding protein n=1 Tax=unclassified Frankia TaxID=2632575 RepID=UPI00193303BB|nr:MULTISPECIES: AMP-binding protein [unclassified Frankia]MBL7487570.1 AMP-binding protein [Frankia sp. AgW1.1]MBL7549542.1 AMP-binding protein [Frankia sp. AgB1.9]MBL7620669.1 AMP-binding protein [Frankia sp. AgB1.8]